MIEGQNALIQTLLGTLLTWGLTAAGAAVVVIIHGTQRKLLDTSLGFAGGVMIAASYWSLLAPAIELAEESKYYGEKGEFAFVPVAIGFLLGGSFVFFTDVLISSFGLCAPHLMLAMENDVRHLRKKDDSDSQQQPQQQERFGSNQSLKVVHLDEMNGRRRTIPSNQSASAYYVISNAEPSGLQMHRSVADTHSTSPNNVTVMDNFERIHHSELRRPPSSLSNDSLQSSLVDQWKRIVLLIVAITVHNIPEGLAVGVGFGAIGSASSATFESARNLAIGIGIQNFPEGLAVSLPLRAAGFSIWRSFWYGQLSGMVEPIFGILGALAVSLARPILPYALSFAAGAMIYVVVDDIIPEANSSGNGKLASWGSVMGFLVMMVLDVGLG